MSAAADKRTAAAVAEVFAFMRKRGLSFEYLIEVGGEDLKSDQVTAEKAKSVEKSWSLLAKLGVKYADLEDAASTYPVEPARRRRGEGVLSEVIENKEVFAGDTPTVKSLKNNNKRDDHSVGASEKGRWKLKRHLAPKLEPTS